MNPDLMLRVIQLARESATSGGGPFGALLADGDRIVAEGHNRVVLDRDPSAHAEVVALRAAARELGTHELHGLVLYTSCEPCPMCLGAAWWARVDRILYAASRAEAARAGFDDAELYAEVARPLGQRVLPIERLLPREGALPFQDWLDNEGRTPY